MTDLYDALAKKYAEPEWVIAFEVRNGTGWVKNERRADAVALNCYPSRGLSLLGFEIKASRSDWLRELKNPDKAERISAYCDTWWIVAPAGIVKTEEVPHLWGLIEHDGSGLTTTKQALALRSIQADPPRQFWASLIRSIAQSRVPKVSIQSKLDESYKAGEAFGASWEAKYKETYEEKLRLQELLGVHEWDTIEPWWAGAIKKILKATPQSVAQKLEMQRNQLLVAVKELESLEAGILKDAEAEVALLKGKEAKQ